MALSVIGWHHTEMEINFAFSPIATVAMLAFLSSRQVNPRKMPQARGHQRKLAQKKELMAARGIL